MNTAEPAVVRGKDVTGLPSRSRSILFSRIDDPVFRRRWKFIGDCLQTFVIVLGIPVGIYNYIEFLAKDRKQAEWATYEKMDDRYWTYERLAMDYPSLNVSDAGISDPEIQKLMKPRDSLTPEERVHERQFMLMLIAMYERAFILYADKTTSFRAEEWTGWLAGLRRWVKSPAFTDAWDHIGTDFDEKYQACVNALRKSTTEGPVNGC